MSKLYIDGKCKFKNEYEYAKTQGTDNVNFILDHVIDEHGVGEPEEDEEIINMHIENDLI